MQIIDLSNNLKLTRKVKTTRSCRNGDTENDSLTVAAEHTMDVYLNDVYAMRLVCTPNLLAELVLGRLYTEGLISSVDDVEQIIVNTDGTQCRAVIHKEEQTNTDLKPVIPIEWKPEWIYALAEQMEAVTPLFLATHAVHSCYLAAEGKTLYCCEDLGRHNAVDKAIGCALRDSVNLRNCVLFSSGRQPTDMVTKCIRAGIPVLASKTVPTDRGIALAEKYHLTLIAFARNNRFTIVCDDKED